MGIKIAYLADYKEYISAAAHWAFLTYGKYTSTTFKTEIEKFRNHCNEDKLPLTLIALDNNDRFIGMASLREKEEIKTELK